MILVGCSNGKTAASDTDNFTAEPMKNEQMYLHPELETMSRPEIEKLQLKRLQQTIRRCMHSPFYEQRFDEAGLKPADIRSWDDLLKIPFTTKQDLRDH